MTHRALDELDKAINEEGGWKMAKKSMGGEVSELIEAKRWKDVITVSMKVTYLVTKVYERRE